MKYIRKVWLPVLLLLMLCVKAQAQPDSLLNSKSAFTSNYFETIRNNEVQLRHFFQLMPKGGDLHHHYSGSVYGETYLKAIEEDDLWVNRNTYELLATSPPKKERNIWSKISSLKQDGLWSEIKLGVIKSWSIKYFDFFNGPSDEHFFETFSNFSIPKKRTYKIGLEEIKKRAISENVSYIETMFTSLKFNIKYNDFEPLFETELTINQSKPDKDIGVILESLYQKYIEHNDYKDIATKHNSFLEELHNDLLLDDEDFTIRFQNYAIRVTNPIHVFKHLLVCFESASTSDLIVGVNFVAPEHNEISMRDYLLHMQMFNFLHQKYPNVKYSLHAGELVLGLVPSEELTWHIGAAVKIAQAYRIGHGVDIAHENNSYNTLDYMKTNNIPVEINLTSNEFILGISKDKHPILIYNEEGVPIIISTDDAGVLRTDLTEQYVIIGKNYSNISYLDIKKYAYNSIIYSFLSEELKKNLLNKLDVKFEYFETLISNRYCPLLKK